MSELKAITEEQRGQVEKLGNGVSMVFDDEGTGLHIDDYISFNEMADIVDYLRSQQVVTSIEPLRIEETDTFDINKMRNEFKELAAKWRNIAGDADISVNVWSHTRENPVPRYDTAPIVIDINCNASVKELEL